MTEQESIAALQEIKHEWADLRILAYDVAHAGQIAQIRERVTRLGLKIDSLLLALEREAHEEANTGR